MTKQILFTDVVLEWLQTIEFSCKESTYFKYYRLYDTHIYPYFKEINASEITSKHLVQFLSFLKSKGRKDGKGGLSGSLSTIKYILQSSIEYGSENNYMNHIQFKYRIQQTKYDEIEVLTPNEITKLEEYLLNNIDISNLGILLCLYTGLRIGEVCALQWKDISLEQSYLIVNKTVQRLRISTENSKTELKITSPKSRTSFRKVPIPTYICNLLEIYKPKDLNEYLLTQTFNPLDPRTYQNRFKTCLKKSNIRYVNFHALRHTFATRCIQAGIDVKTVSEILGHSNIQITMNYYVYSSFDFKKQQIEKLCAYKN